MRAMPRSIARLDGIRIGNASALSPLTRQRAWLKPRKLCVRAALVSNPVSQTDYPWNNQHSYHQQASGENLIMLRVMGALALSALFAAPAATEPIRKIGRASCRERG